MFIVTFGRTVKKNHTRKYFEWYEAKKPSGQPHKRDHKNRSLNFTFTTTLTTRLI